jgi:chromosome segregation ATPase
MLDELRAEHDECGKFFGEVFDQLQSLSLELFARHKCLELTAQQQAERESAEAEDAGRFKHLLDEVQQARTEMRELQKETQQAWVELRKTCDRIEHERAESPDVQESLQAHFDRLAAAIGELTEARSQLIQAGDGVGKEQIDQILEDTRQQRASWEQERSAMETELEAVRERAAELAEALAGQKRSATQQQAEWTGELRRMRSLLEAISGQMAQEEGRASAAQPARSNGTGAGSGDPALDSVMAQFQLLQHEVAQRRAGRNSGA